MTDKAREQLEHLSEIRDLMKESSQFLSLSGMSGVFAGIFALIGAALVRTDFIEILSPGYLDSIRYEPGLLSAQEIWFKLGYFLLVGLGVLVASLIMGFALTIRKAKKNDRKLFDTAAKKLILNLFIPLFLGGIFCIGLILHGNIGTVAPATLMFYGMALLNAGKYTYRDIRYLGICEMILGVASMFFVGYGLYFWAFGFGVLHIIYGFAMYMKYERG
ncbi:MAG: hypothetical protein JKY54_15315 [Flavobacteriales bacterium]|nr:hypothetical protein [Flavobacteriales bacterium]